MTSTRVTFDLGDGAAASSAATDDADEHGGDRAQITFLCDPGLEDTIPHPQRASRFAPDWFRAMPRETGTRDAHGLPGLTVKACMPVTDAFSLGFVIPSPYDIHLEVADNLTDIRFGWDEACRFQPIEAHQPAQLGAPAPPFGQVMPLKFINPWRIKVPEDYSLLFVPVMNRPEQPFFTFSGLVDCDRFATTINFPFIWNGGPGQFVIPAGTPMSQIVPIKRDAMIRHHDVRASTEAELAEQAEARERKYKTESTYRKEWRAKK